MRLHNLLSLTHLPPRCIRGKEPLVDYFQSHVIFVEYSNILRRKAMDKVAVEETRGFRKKKKKGINKWIRIPFQSPFLV
jgi:hypothetical protein